MLHNGLLFLLSWLYFTRSVIAGIDGFFHIGSSILASESADAILSPGRRSGHSHSIFGGNAFKLALGDNELLESTCTTNSIKQDASAYWVAMTYFAMKNGSFTTIKAEDTGLTVYYDYKKTDEPFPAVGFAIRMTNALEPTSPPLDRVSA